MSKPFASSFTEALVVAPVRAPAPAASRPLAARSDIEIAVIADLAAVEAEWRAFQATADGTVFQTYDWLAKWQRHIGVLHGTRPAIVIGRDASGAALFLLPLAVERVGMARRLTWLGAALCDYNGPLLSPDFAARIGDGFPALWRRITQLLRADARFRFDFIDLSKMTETVGGQRNPFFALSLEANPSGAYVATLGEDWDTFYAARRSGPTRKKERKQLKQLGEHGAIRFAGVGDEADAERVLDVLIEQKSRSFARLGVRNNFERDGYRAFYLDLVTDRAVADVVHLSHLDVGDLVAASSIGLRFGGSYYLVLSSYDDGPISRLGPGRAHLQELIRFAMAEKLGRFDFTIGDEPYKRDWADVVVRPHDHLAGVTPLGHLVVLAMLAFRNLKRSIKQTPVLWRAFSRLRSLKSALTGGGRRAAEPAADEGAAD